MNNSNQDWTNYQHDNTGRCAARTVFYTTVIFTYTFLDWEENLPFFFCEQKRYSLTLHDWIVLSSKNELQLNSLHNFSLFFFKKCLLLYFKYIFGGFFFWILFDYYFEDSFTNLKNEFSEIDT